MTGARGLRTIVEGRMLDVMYSGPSEEDVSKCVITTAVVETREQPLLVRSKSKGKGKEERACFRRRCKTIGRDKLENRLILFLSPGLNRCCKLGGRSCTHGTSGVDQPFL